MRINASEGHGLPTQSHALVTGRSRVKTAQPVTALESVSAVIHTPSNTDFITQVTGNKNYPSTHARAGVRGLEREGLIQPVTTRDQGIQSVLDAQNTVTGSQIARDQPVTSASYLLPWIAHAQEITRSDPEKFPILQNYSFLRSQARELVDAAHAGEDVDTLTALAQKLETSLYRIQNNAQQFSPDKFTNGRAKDRLSRTKAQPRTSAPTRKPRPQEVPTMRATAASAPVPPKKPARRQSVTPEAVTEALCREYEALEASRPANDPFLGLAAHALTCLAPALLWVGGDPCTAQFPAAFQEERLAKTCAWLRGLTTVEQQTTARSQMLMALWQLWPSYAEQCSDKPLWDETQYKERVWDLVSRIESLWVDPLWKGTETAPYLPEFRDTDCGRISYSFHLTLLALVTLNRQLGRPLLALESEQDVN